MSKHWIAAVFALTGLIAVVSLAVPLAAGQGQAGGAKAANRAYSVPKTPWGDPDLQGTWSGDSAQAIPMQRPDQFAGRAELTDEEFNAKLERDTAARKRAQAAAGPFAGDGAWLDKTFRQTSLIVEPADGKLPPLTPEAQRRRDLAPRGTYGNGPLDGPEDFTLYDRCISLGVVGSLTPKIYGNAHRIIQTPGYVAIMNEMIHETRVIPLDNRPHPGKGLRMYMGDSRGRWEGNTLVVETTNLNGKPNYSGQPGADVKLVERFTRVEPDLLRYEAIIDDPSTYTRTVKLSIPMTSPPGYQLLPYECHEGNSALRQGLGGERVEDKRLEEDARKGIFRPRRPIQGELSVGGGPIGATPGARGAGPGGGEPPPQGR